MHHRSNRGRVLAVKWGMNPNSSSLGVDVTFLIAGASLVAIATPVIGALIRARANRLLAANPRSEQRVNEDRSERELL